MVTIHAVNWGLSGSPLIESFGLARRFSLDFETSLSWAPASSNANGNSSDTDNGMHRVLKMRPRVALSHLCCCKDYEWTCYMS